jgi:hypothetical protein
MTFKRDGFTVTIVSYRIVDEKHVIIDATIRNDYNFTIRIQYGQGSATSSDGIELGAGYLSPHVDLLPHTAVSVEAYLESSYTGEQLLAMRDSVTSVQVHAELRYCVILGWWCAPISPTLFYALPPYTFVGCNFTSCTLTYERTFTITEIAQLAQQYGWNPASYFHVPLIVFTSSPKA